MKLCSSVAWRAFAVAFSASCGGQGSQSKVSEIQFTVHEVDRITTRLSESSAESPLQPELAFLLREKCPTVTSARLRFDAEAVVGVVEVWGQHLDSVWGIVGVSSGGDIGRAKKRTGDEEAVRFAVGCMDCELLLGFRVDGQEVACAGPGHSLRVRDGELVH